MEYAVLVGVCTAGVYVASMLATTILGFIPTSLGGTSGAAAGTTATPNQWLVLLINGAIIAGVVLAVSHIKGVGQQVAAAEHV